MSSEIAVDRVLATTKALATSGRMVAFGQANDLRRKIIAPNSVGGATIRLVFPREKLRELQNIFKSTFDCNVNCTVFVDGFKNEYNQELTTQIAIDVWNNVVRKALATNQATQ